MPNAVIAHDPAGALRPRGAEGAAPPACPRWTGSTSCRCVTGAQRYAGTRPPGSSAEGYGQRAATPRHHVVAIDYGVKRNILRLLADAGCEVTVVPATATAEDDPGAQARRRLPLQRPRRSGRDRRIRGAGDPRAPRRARCRPSASASATRCSASRVGGADREDAPGPSRRQPPGQGPRPPARSRSSR